MLRKRSQFHVRKAIVAPAALALLTLALATAASRAAAPTPASIWVTSVVHDCAFATDDTVRVDLMLNAIASPIDAGGFKVSYDPAFLTFVSASRGTLIPAWAVFNATDLSTSVAIAASNPTPILGNQSGQFARLTFVTSCCGGASIQNVPLCVAEASGDLATFGTECGNFQCVPGQPGSITVSTLYQSCGSALGDTVEVDVRLENTSQPIDAGGVDIVFDPVKAEYVGFRRGPLTSGWFLFDAANLITRVRAGGFTLAPIPGGTSGVFVTLRFVVSCCNTGFSSPLCAQTAVDDLAPLLLGCGEVVCVPLAVRPVTWGYVKSLYR